MSWSASRKVRSGRNACPQDTIPTAMSTKMSSGARIHRADEHEVGRESECAGGAEDDRHVVFQRLAQRLQVAGTKRGQLVQEKHAAVRQADLARPGQSAAPHQSGVAAGMVRGAKWAVPDQGRVTGKEVGGGVDARDI